MLSRNRKIFAVSSLVLNLFASQIGEFFLPYPVQGSNIILIFLLFISSVTGCRCCHLPREPVKMRYSADQGNFSVRCFQFTFCNHSLISRCVVYTAERARNTLPCSEWDSNSRPPACAVSQADRGCRSGSVTMAVVFGTIEVKHEQLALGPLSVCVFDGVSPEQILGCCLFLRLFQGKLSTGERVVGGT